MEREVKTGQLYRHFKEKLYQIITVAEHSETGERMVVYQALYGDYRTYVRPYEMFVSEVDHEKYPEVTQKYRFELINPERCGNTEDKPEKAAWAAAEAETETGVNPLLLAFLELETFEEKLQFFRDNKKKIDDHLLDSIAASLDIVVDEGPLPQRYQEVLNCLETFEHFECSRFR
ncbi:MAG: DUF1653 domain-containing protein [Lachnospiraceae bacterium]